MLEEVINLQNKAVNELLLAIKTKDTVTFKAPTGAGKTIMMANLMNSILDEDKDITFIVSSLSKSDLAKQNYESFKERSLVENRLLNPYLISSQVTEEAGINLDPSYNVYVLPRDLYKVTSKIFGQGSFIALLQEKIKTSKIYLIKDECHQKTNNLDNLSTYFTKVINVSATPKADRKQIPDVILDENEAVKAHLIKSVEYMDETDDLTNALNKFVEIKKQYLKELHINPCMIIQVSNKDKADSEIEKIKETLNTKFNDLKWMYLLDKLEKNGQTNDKLNKLKVSKWRDYAKQPNATIDILIFKMVITEGWDIPRACMLYQIRDTTSKILDDQVIGRVRRNPCLLNFEKLNAEQQKLASTAFVWGFKPQNQTKLIDVKLDTKAKDKIKREMQFRTTKLKLDYISKSFNIREHISKLNKSPIQKGIFELYRQYQKSSNDLKSLIDTQLTSFKDWIDYSSNTDSLELELKNVSSDYDKTLSVAKDDLGVEIVSSIQDDSSFVKTSSVCNIDNWIWERLDQNNDFSFDSQSEREWFTILRKLTNQSINGHSLIKYVDVKDGVIDKKVFLLAKNYLNNSELKFEYYNYGKRTSYPDFVLKDYKGNLHLFESKCLNDSSTMAIDSIKYQDKINALKECYKATSKLLDYYFYIPTKVNDEWIIFRYYGGLEKQLNKDEFEDFFHNL